MSKLDQKISSQECLIEINKNDFVVKNKSKKINCSALEENGLINLNIEVLESNIGPRINLKVLRDSYINFCFAALVRWSSPRMMSLIFIS